MSRKIYLISTEQDEAILYKIGYTKRAVEQRIKEFRTGNSNHFDIIHVFEPSDFAATIENRLHKKFKHKRINGEWFLLDDGDVAEFLNLCEQYYEDCKFIAENNTYIQDMNYSFK